MKEYSFEKFLKDIEDLDFFDAARKTEQELIQAEHVAKREFKKKSIEQDYRPIRYEKQLSGLMFWFHSCMKPAGLSDQEFLLIKPLCQKLVEKGQLKESALNAFEELRSNQ